MPKTSCVELNYFGSLVMINQSSRPRNFPNLFLTVAQTLCLPLLDSIICVLTVILNSTPSDYSCANFVVIWHRTTISLLISSTYYCSASYDILLLHACLLGDAHMLTLTMSFDVNILSLIYWDAQLRRVNVYNIHARNDSFYTPSIIGLQSGQR